MGIMDKILGRDEEPEQQRRTMAGGTSSGNQAVEKSADEQALERYRYMLQTAPPETIEQAHAEAFAKLTPEQRQMVLQQLTQSVPETERAAAKDDPQSLARMATRAEVRQPGTMERTFSSMGGGMGMGGMMAGSFLSSIAGVVVGSAIAQSFFGGSGFFGGGDGDNDASANDNQNAGDETAADTGGEMDAGDMGGDVGGDFGGFDI
ncbi:MAG: hypothetical protein H0T45_19440 [Pyrinomonadaceae bacterium]|nr:hypothetical protein [Pyrinomonadaceae bacterium]